MSNIRYKNALTRHIEKFKSDFLEFSRGQFQTIGKQNKLIHPGEFGTLRENISKKLIEGIIPSSKKIQIKGFILNSNNDTSTEQDLVIYSDTDTPVLTLENASFFPIETVVSIGQIKSVIQSKSDLKDILDKLVQVKKIEIIWGMVV